VKDIAAVMVTVDRSPSPNYLAETLGNLKRSDLRTSSRLHSFALSDSGLGLEWSRSVAESVFPELEFEELRSEPKRRNANTNVAHALHHGYNAGVPWVLFLEDDIDVIDRFFDSVGAWLDSHARPDRHLYALGCPYAGRERTGAWEYAIDGFYGTQAVAFRRDDALDLSNYLVEHCYDRHPDGAMYDLLMHDWAYDRWPRIKHFLASIPSFVQHTGRESVINPRAHTHIFPSWPGPEWSYAGA
jgi:hypothetical protein